ncbi:MAG TPA: hypothetical protein VNA04_13075 [Thermoanaerobaculia bacterium]|nr:hypothetical protein [Thermoanaerobaculia bacterium]
MAEHQTNPEIAIDELVRSLDHCSTKLKEIRTIVDEIEPGEIRTLLMAAAARLEQESDEIRSSLGMRDDH